MYISKVSLINYKNFANAKFLFNKGINTIIGENGAGKTNVFQAIRLLLEDTSLHYSYKLTENDFNRVLENDTWKGHWIIISLEFNELTNEEAIQSLFIHGTGIAEDDYVDKASYNLF
ncbi:MAG: AAA family ATPase, partial [Flavobacteriales bacterium]